MENSWSDLTGHAPAGPVRDALQWVAAAVEAPGPLSPELLDDRLRLRIFTGRQALARLEELRRLRAPFWNVEVETESAHAADLRFLTADDLHVRLHCEVWEHEPRHLKVLRLDWIGPEEIPLMDWEQVPDLMALYRVPALSVAWTDGTGEPVARAWGADRETRFAAGSVAKPLSSVTALALAGRGVLALDEDVNDRLTSWRVPACGSWQPRVTLRALLSHSSGLPVFYGMGHEVDEPARLRPDGGRRLGRPDRAGARPGPDPAARGRRRAPRAGRPRRHQPGVHGGRSGRAAPGQAGVAARAGAGLSAPQRAPANAGCGSAGTEGVW
jgi:hypothetical protein